MTHPHTPSSEADQQDLFALLGLQRGNTIDNDDLRRAWLSRSAQLHPDRAVDDPEASAKIARLNDAKAVLENPEARANHLLLLLGGPGKEQDKDLPDGFLMDIFEIRERHEKGDQANRAEIEAWAHEQRAAYEQRVGALFEALSEPPDAHALRAIRRELNAWRYIERFLSTPSLE